MDYECFEVDESDGVAHVRLSRGDKLNTMIAEFWSELPALIDELSRAQGTRVVVISAEGKHFCAGLDLAIFAKPSPAANSSDEAGRQRSMVRLTVMAMQNTFNALERARMPVLVAVHGACIGGAVDMITAADCRYATADAWFCIQEVNIGMTADVGTLQRLPKLIPHGVALEYAYTGRRMSARRALELGLVNEVFETREAMMEAVMGIASEIASKSPLAIHGTKIAVNYARDHPVDDALNQIALWQSGMFHPTDVRESMRARAEDRDPAYENLPEVPNVIIG